LVGGVRVRCVLGSHTNVFTRGEGSAEEEGQGRVHRVPWGGNRSTPGQPRTGCKKTLSKGQAQKKREGRGKPRKKR